MLNLIKKTFLIFFLGLIFISVFFLFFEQVQASDNQGQGGWIRGDPWDLEAIDDVLIRVIDWARGIAPLLGATMIAIAGMMFIFSAGQPQGIANARAALLAAGIGIMIITGARDIICFFIELFGGTCPNS